MCEKYGQRPSRVIGITDEWAGYQFDMAVLEAGLRAVIEASDPKKKPSPNGKLEAGKFTPPGPVRKMVIPENGIW